MNRRICLILIVATGPLGETSAQLSHVDVFPLARKLHYSYLYESLSSYYDLNVLVSESIDSGTVEYVVDDSTQIGDTVVVWSVKQSENLWHSRFGHAGDTAYWTIRDTIVLLTERLLDKHELKCSSLVWMFPLTKPDDSIFRYTDNSPYTLVRRYQLPGGPGNSSGFDSLYFASSIGFHSRLKQEEGHAISHFYSSLKVSQLAVPTYVNDDIRPVSSLVLCQNFPNPFNPATTISFSLPSQSFVSLKVFDALGRDVSILLADELPAGTYTRQWNAVALPTGVYYYRLQAGSFSETKKITLLR